MPSSKCKRRKISTCNLVLIRFRDWKKLTFYYFADSYINFNPLVTDLFKIYKTRIWMSAINPASFITPSTGLQLPCGIGTDAFSQGSEVYNDHRPHKHNPGISVAGPSQASLGGFDRMWDPHRDTTAALSVPFPHIYAPPLQQHDLDNHQLDRFSIDYHHGGQQAIPVQPHYNPTSHNAPDLNNPSYTISSVDNGAGTRKPYALGSDWSHAFQGLSLGS